MSVKQEIFELFYKYGKMMAEQPYPLGEEARMILDTSEGVFGTKKGANLGSLKRSDVVKLSDQHLSTSRYGMVARVVSQTPYCQQCLHEGKSFRAVLDDMAQIVGSEAVIVDMTGKNRAKASLKMALAAYKAAGCFVQDRVRDGMPAGYTMTIGRSLYEAVVAMTVLEKSAEIYLKSSAVGGSKPIPKMEAKAMRKFYEKKYSRAENEFKEEETAEGVAAMEAEEAADIPDADEREMELRQTLVDYGNKLVACGLVQGTWGNISIRLDDKYMLATPSGLDYSRLTAADMVKVNIETLDFEGEKKPTSEKELHAFVYQRRPEIGAVIHTHSKYCCIFAAANKEMPIEDVQAQEVFGTSVRLAKYGLPGSSKLARHTVEALGDNFGCIMANHGMLTCGADIETAFANCQMLEGCGETYIESRWK